jgi:hypothetical protein
MDLRSLVFHGGDPLANPDQLKWAFGFCRDRGFKGMISVITNGTLIDGHMVGTFLDYHIHPVIPVFPATGQVSFSAANQHLVDFAGVAHRAGVPFSVTQVLRTNGMRPAESMEFIRSLGPATIKSALVFDAAGDDCPAIPAEAGSMTVIPTITTSRTTLASSEPLRCQQTVT